MVLGSIPEAVMALLSFLLSGVGCCTSVGAAPGRADASMKVGRIVQGPAVSLVAPAVKSWMHASEKAADLLTCTATNDHWSSHLLIHPFIRTLIHSIITHARQAHQAQYVPKQLVNSQLSTL